MDIFYPNCSNYFWFDTFFTFTRSRRCITSLFSTANLMTSYFSNRKRFLWKNKKTKTKTKKGKECKCTSIGWFLLLVYFRILIRTDYKNSFTDSLTKKSKNTHIVQVNKMFIINKKKVNKNGKQSKKIGKLINKAADKVGYVGTFPVCWNVIWHCDYRS